MPELTELDLEIAKLYKEIQERYDKLMCLIIKKKYGVDIQFVDEEHISIDGVVMDDQEFTDWLIDQGGLDELGLSSLFNKPKNNYDA